MAHVCGHGGKSTIGRFGLTVAVVAPAGDGPVGSEGARMPRTQGDGGVLAVGRVGSAVGVVAPAGDGLVGSEGA